MPDWAARNPPRPLFGPLDPQPFASIGELFLAPVGLALISRLAPARVLSLMMGVWFATTFPGDVLGGWLGGFWSSMEKAHFFLMIGAIAGAAGLAMLALGPALRSVFDEHQAS